MFRVKICGITNIPDALDAVRVGADAVGLNFFAGSPRCVTIEAAREIVAALPAAVVRVGVFVDHAAAEICRIFDQLSLDLVQLHGGQSPEFLTQLGDRPLMPAFRIGPEGLAPVLEHLRRCRELGVAPHCVLFDSLASDRLGGTGRRGDWSVAARYASLPDVPPLVLAGGLTPENVAEAIRAVHPAAVDVASGVESSPGCKDRAAIESFVRAARGG